MQNLIDFASRDDVKQFVRTVLAETRSGLFQGVLVGYHPLWRTFAHNKNYLKEHMGFPFDMEFLDDAYLDDVYDGIETEDPRAEWWAHVCRTFLRQEPSPPFVIIFRLRPFGVDRISEYQKIAQIVRSARNQMFATVEQRPLAKMFAGPVSDSMLGPLEGGLKIRTSAGVTGTLGGFLKNVVSGQHFGSTCAHVAKIGDAVDYFDSVSGVWRYFGRCVESSSLPASPNCNVNCYLEPGAVDVDAALIELDRSVASARISSISGIVDEIVDPRSIPKTVGLVGAECGHLMLNADKFGMWHELQLPSGDCACFRDIFEVNSKAISNLSSKLSLLFSKMVRNGDSGAWVLAANTSGGYAYCGSLIGGDTISGFATFSKNIQNWAADANRVGVARVLGVI